MHSHTATKTVYTSSLALLPASSQSSCYKRQGENGRDDGGTSRGVSSFRAIESARLAREI